MKIVSPAPLRWLRRENFSSALAAAGALSFPVFMVMARFAIVLVSGATSTNSTCETRTSASAD